jgi:hypothetical protein
MHTLKVGGLEEQKERVYIKRSSGSTQGHIFVRSVSLEGSFVKTGLNQFSTV